MRRRKTSGETEVENVPTLQEVIDEGRQVVLELYAAADRLDEAIATKVREREGGNSDAR